jgi:hypothetical protein
MDCPKIATRHEQRQLCDTSNAPEESTIPLVARLFTLIIFLRNVLVDPKTKRNKLEFFANLGQVEIEFAASFAD